jgi:hypothetical protein
MGDFLALPEAGGVSFIEAVGSAAIAVCYGMLVEVCHAVDSTNADIWGVLHDVAVGNGGIWTDLGKVLSDLIHFQFRQFLSDLVAWLGELRAKIAIWLKPLTDYLKFEKWWLDQVFNHVLKPILDFIQGLRRILLIFRLLHIGWASKLDEWLAGLESELVTKFMQARSDIQVLANWINWILGPGGLFSFPLLLLSQLQTLPQLWAALANIPSQAVAATTAQAQQASRASGTRTGALSEIRDRGDTPTGDDLIRYAQVRAIYQADGYTV